MNSENQSTNHSCYECGCVVSTDDAYFVEDEYYCTACYDAYFVDCRRCGDIIRISDAVSDDDNDFCQSCYDDYYTRCDECRYIISSDNAYYHGDCDEPYCEDCYRGDDEDGVFIHDYNYKPDPIFFGSGNRYFGLELEIDKGGKSCDKAEILLDIANHNEETIYIKSDGSLSCGMEVVTHPLTLEYHEKTMQWNELLIKSRELGYLSHKTTTCGLHIHVNRDSFGEDYEKQEECIAHALYIVERFWEELLRFSRRTQSQLNQWARRYGYKENPREILDTAKKGYGSRYTCVNLTNTHTIEFRIFRGTLKYNSLIAALQLVDAICDTAISMSDSEIAALGWSDFVKLLPYDKYPQLIIYLKERQLYVNEPVDHEEDD